MNYKMIRTIIKEYGASWVFNRSLYSLKLKILNVLPITEKVFEKQIKIERLDIFDLNTKSIEKFLNNLSEEKKKEIILIADNAIEGRIMGFSSIELDYGNPINWHLNPITKKVVDNSLKWFQIPDFDPERGDIKVIWEASRFTHFLYFIRAYMITKNRKYYDAFSSQLEGWLKDNPYSYGANYKCGQEATLRAINTLISYSAFKSYGLITPKVEENVKKIVEGSYKKVLSNFFYAQKCIKNNHTLSEITGLIIGAWSCKDEKRLKKAYYLLDKEIKNQFLPDGGYIQYSFNYQRFALQIMEFILKISDKVGKELSKNSKELIKKSAYLMYQMQDDTGDVPNYGANDGALIFPLTSCGYRDFRPVLNTIFSLIDGKRVYKPGEYDEELLWFVDKNIENIPISITERKSSSFPISGFYSLRHNKGFLMTVLQDYKSRPGQMDQLHIDLWHRGINVFCDSGTYSYATDIGKGLSLTSAHNTVKVQEKEQMNKYGPFLTYDWSKCKDISHNSDFFTGKMISKNGYLHSRTIKKINHGYRIIDELTGDADYCEFYFHTPCDVTKDSSGCNLYYNGEYICSLKTDEIIEIKKSYRSLYYFKKEPITCIVIRSNFIKGKCNVTFEIELFND